MPAIPPLTFAATDPAGSGATNLLVWIASNAADEILVVAALAFAGVLALYRIPSVPLDRRLGYLFTTLAALSAIFTVVLLALGIGNRLSTGSVILLCLATLLWSALIVLLWRSIRGRLRDRNAHVEDLARLKLLAAAVSASEDGVMIAEADREEARLRIVYANPAFERMTGYSLDEAVGLSPSVLADNAEPESLEVIRQALRGTVPVRLEVPGRRKDGSHMWTEWQVVPVADSRGRFTHSVAVLRDTTLRRRDEQALRDSESRFRGLFEQAADAILVVDIDGRIADANRRACHCLGYSAKELTRMRMEDLDAGTRFVDLGPGETFTAENWYRRKDGTEFPVEVRFAVLDAGGKRLKLALVRDVTRRRSAEQALREREELLRHIIAHIPCGVFWKDRNSVYLGCNERVASDQGYDSPDKLVGRTDYDIMFSRDEATFYRNCDQQVMETGLPILNLEEAQTRRNGEVSTLLTSKVPLRDAGGDVVGIVGVYQDITEHKRLEEQLQQAQKLEAVGRLAGGIAHDFNNLLTIIRGNADLLRSPANGDRQPELLDDLRLAADRAAALVRQLLMFSRRQPARSEVVDLNAVVERLGGLLNRLLGERIVVETRLAPGPVTIRSDNSHIEQVIMNLAVNARDAMPDGGTLTLRTEAAENSDHGEARGRVARLIVSDTGVGMSDEIRAQCFEPFFTTKGPDKGTGLGLATVFGIVEQAGGRIGVTSALGAGTTFRITLPWCEEAPSPILPTPAPVAIPDRPLKRNASVLLVEDEDAVRKLARITLEGQGYSVTDVPDGESALRLLNGDRRLDVLVTDLTMPGIDGRELAGRVRALRPDSGVVFVSGYVPDVARLGDLAGAIFLPKPFTPSDLVRAVGRVAPRLPAPFEPPPVEASVRRPSLITAAAS
jgi:two-component system, cell cycle sensor histidine kinase and response regulator CckA